MLCPWNDWFWPHRDYLDEATSLLQTGSFNAKIFVSSMLDLVYHEAIGLAGALAFIALFCRIFDSPNLKKWTKKCASWGQYTQGIYILHVYMLEVLLMRFLCFNGYNFWLFNFVITPLLSLIMLAVCVYMIKIIQKSRPLSFILLGNL